MFCPDFMSPVWLIFSSASELTLIYYSHIPAALTALFAGFFVFFKGKDDRRAAVHFLLMNIAFVLWAFASLITWTNTDSRHIMIAWM